jgi:hypothetical protein
MKAAVALALLLALAGCALPTTGVIPRPEGLYTVTRQGNGAWVQPPSLTNEAILEASAYCKTQSRTFKQVHVKEIPSGVLGRWPESELLFPLRIDPL